MTYVFNFKAETARLRNDYPDTAKNVAFIDLSEPDAVQRLIDWNIAHGGPVQAQLMTDAKFRELFIHRAFGGPAFYPSFSGEGGVIAMDGTKPAAMGLKDRDKSLFQILAHEFGHVLFPGVKDKNLRECFADVFSLLYGARHRILGSADAENLAQMRAAQGLIDGLTSHITTRAIDSVSKALRRGTGLTPALVLGLTSEHAEKGAFSKTGMRGLEGIFNRFSGQNRQAIIAHKTSVPKNKRVLLSDAALENPSVKDRLAAHFSNANRCLGSAGAVLKALPFTQSAANAAICAKVAKYLGGTT